MRTPHQILGPFFPQGLIPTSQGDLTIVEGVDGHAQGEIIEVTGRVLDLQGKPIPDQELQTAEKVAAQDSLDSKSFTAWAREESASSTVGTLAKEGIYAGTGYLLSGQVLSKLHIADEARHRTYI